MRTYFNFHPVKLIFSCLLLALCHGSYAAENSINLDNWGLLWGMPKDKFKLEYCSKIYEYTETCVLKDAAKNSAHTKFYLLDFNSQNQLTGFRYISKKLYEPGALKLLNLLHKQYAVRYKKLTQNSPDTAKADFLACVSYGKCTEFALNITEKNSSRIEVSLAPSNIPPFDIELNTESKKLTTGIVYVRYENSELGAMSEKIKGYKFAADNMRWDDFLNPPLLVPEAQLPYSPEEFNLRWGMTPQDMLKLGILCYEILTFYTCAPGNLSDFVPSLYTFTGHKNLGLVEFSFFHDIGDNESGTQGNIYFKQIVRNTLGKYTGAALAKHPQALGLGFCVAGNCVLGSKLIYLNGTDARGGTIGIQRTLSKKDLKSNIAITYTRYLTEEQKKETGSL